MSMNTSLVGFSMGYKAVQNSAFVSNHFRVINKRDTDGRTDEPTIIVGDSATRSISPKNGNNFWGGKMLLKSFGLVYFSSCF